ncbi:cytosine permease [Clostridium sp. SHJSY1]|uniref:purine-cytosine permease family protein n=1 Tax=Clostridium sp. SHJSY1 TaxID=2942483 RepID=UPI00287435D3|nr:cytosine permease [Clostridium sp. SHJSY1]MDS0525838.1 cytosine permease [Clostridium sp. SHJSY1]
MDNNVDKQMEREAVFGIIPVLQNEKIYGFLDAFLILSGYCIATWSYTQGTYLTTLVGFKQLLIGAFIGAILMLVIYQLPVILSVRYGIDIWIWLRSVFGISGVKIMALIIIVINYPWYAVCADLFASSMTNLAEIFGISLPPFIHVILAISCVIIGTLIAYKGIGTITWATRILVPLLLAAGVMVVVIGFTSVPAHIIWDYKPQNTGYSNNIIPYIISIEANFAFVITLVGGMAGVPRLTKNERAGYWAGVLGQGVSGSFFVVVGAVMSIAMQYAVGKTTNDPTTMIATLSVPALAFASLLLVAFANIGTQAVGSYIYGVMLKSSFRKAKYNVIIVILAVYVIILCIWGRIIQFFGPFLTISASVYAPLAALLFVDFFFVRKQKISLRSAFNLKGYCAYKYTKGINWVGFLCVVVGIGMSLIIYNPVTAEVHNMFLFHFTPTGFSFFTSGALYYGLSRIPCINRYLLQDRNEITI